MLSNHPIDNCAHAREDAGALTALRARLPERTLVVLDGDIGVTAEDPTKLAYMQPSQWSRLNDLPRTLLGTDQQYVYWAISLQTLLADSQRPHPLSPSTRVSAAAAAVLPTPMAFRSLRELLPCLAPSELHLAALARQLVHFQERHRYCGQCAHATTLAKCGFQLCCSNLDCGALFFPRLDPAIIVQVTHGERILLGRQASWAPGRYSTLAGFVEPQETLEQAVIREVHEETSVWVRDPQYFGSQPWPFPASLMLGFTAKAISSDIHCRDSELEDARWFSVREIEANAVSLLPSPQSISYQLIEAWYRAQTHADLPSPSRSHHAR
jgi:NADH pyrophosphatase NudC (nudix superfamily)